MKKLILIGLTLFFHMNMFSQDQLINFETNLNVSIDTTISGNIWQIGKPQKTFFDSAYSAPNAIVTDTLNL